MSLYSMWCCTIWLSIALEIRYQGREDGEADRLQEAQEKQERGLSVTLLEGAWWGHAHGAQSLYIISERDRNLKNIQDCRSYGTLCLFALICVFADVLGTFLWFLSLLSFWSHSWTQVHLTRAPEFLLEEKVEKIIEQVRDKITNHLQNHHLEITVLNNLVEFLLLLFFPLKKKFFFFLAFSVLLSQVL